MSHMRGLLRTDPVIPAEHRESAFNIDSIVVLANKLFVEHNVSALSPSLSYIAFESAGRTRHNRDRVLRRQR